MFYDTIYLQSASQNNEYIISSSDSQIALLNILLSNNIYKILVNNQEFFLFLVFFLLILFLEFFFILEFFFSLKIISLPSMNIFLIEKSNQHLCFSRKLILKRDLSSLLKRSFARQHKRAKRIIYLPHFVNNFYMLHNRKVII